MNTPRALDISIVTGQSGSGKSTAIRALEDAGYFCVDNIPTALCEPLVELFAERPANKLAIGLDMREGAFLREAPALIAALKKRGHSVCTYFFAAKPEVVRRRYSQTRRLHPLDQGVGLSQAIDDELALLAPLRELADEVIDTSHMTPHGLRAAMGERVSAPTEKTALRCTVLSFGFKNGLPLEADMVLDVRFLPNPFFVPELSDNSGLEPNVAAFVLEQPAAVAFLAEAERLLHFLLPHYAQEGKRYFTLAIGCTGGRHRSVAIAEALGRALGGEGRTVQVRHRDMAGFVPAEASAPSDQALPAAPAKPAGKRGRP